MAILLSGDFHNNECGEMRYITKKALIAAYCKLYDEIKYHIILGDAGFLWPEYGGYKNRDKDSFEILKERKFPVLCVMGNHDPVYGRNDLPEKDIGIGEKVIVVNERNPFVAYLKRGKIYNIDGYKILVLGGAKSTDKHKRVKNQSWWKKEYWSKKEIKDIFELIKTDNKFDFVLSHTGTNSIHKCFGMMGVSGRNEKADDEVAGLNEMIDKIIKRRAWFFAHWHFDFLDKDIFRDKDTANKKYFCLYNDTLLLKENKAILCYNPFKERQNKEDSEQGEYKHIRMKTEFDF